MMRCTPKIARGHLMCFYLQHGKERVLQIEALGLIIESMRGEQPWKVTGLIPSSGEVLFFSRQERTYASDWQSH